jgi:hypothetical protein
MSKGLCRFSAPLLLRPRLLVALVLASPLQADCRDPAQPRVDWTSCARGHLMLEQEDFTEGVFSRAVGWKANFTRANLQRANLLGADFSRAFGLTPSQLSLACGTADTKLPAGTPIPDTWPCPPETD